MNVLTLSICVCCLTYIHAGNIVSAYFYSNGSSLSWDQAYTACLSRNMELAKINSQTDLDSAVEYIESMRGNIVNDMWIGLKYDLSSSPKVYRWIDTEELTFSNWDPPWEPNEQLTDLCIRLSGLSFRFLTIRCSSAYDYLCTASSKPDVYRNTTIESAYADGIVTFECPFHSVLPITSVNWEFASDSGSQMISSTTNTNKYSGSTITTPSLTVMNATYTDIGNYSCWVENAVGTGKGLPIRFIVAGLSKPGVYRNTTIKSSFPDGTVTFECPYHSVLPVTSVNWEFASDTGSVILSSTTNTNKYSGSTITTTSLTVMNATNTDIGNYSCWVENAVGTGKGLPIRFIIVDTPQVTTPILLYTALRGDIVALKCNVSATPAVIKVEWIKLTNNAPIRETTIQIISLLSNSAYLSLTTTDLQFDSVALVDAGNYTCSATNDLGTTTSDVITLTVLGIVVDIPSPYYTVNYGDEITLPCFIESIPLLQNVLWTRDINGVILDVEIEDASKYQGSSILQPSITITATNLTDQGSYYCVGHNDVSFAKNITYLNVIGGVPQISVNQSLLFVHTTESISIFCHVHSLPNATSLFWTQELGSVETVVKTTFVGLDSELHFLHFLSVELSDNGNYACHAVNEVGMTSSSNIQLNVTQVHDGCPCSCDYKENLNYWSTQNLNYTTEEWRTILAPVLLEIHQNLSVDVDSLTNTKLKYTSATDNRGSSTGIGVLGLLFIVLIVAFLLWGDMLSVILFLKVWYNQIK